MNHRLDTPAIGDCVIGEAESQDLPTDSTLLELMESASFAERALHGALSRAASDPLIAAADPRWSMAFTHDLRDALRELGAHVFALWRDGGYEAVRRAVQTCDSDSLRVLDGSAGHSSSPYAGADHHGDGVDDETGPLSKLADLPVDDADDSEADPGSEQGPSLEVTPELIERLKAGMQPTLDSETEARQARRSAEHAKARDEYSEFGPVPTALGKRAAVAELTRLESLIFKRLESWDTLPKELNRMLTRLATTRARSVQEVFLERRPSMESELERIDAVIRRLSRHSAESRPGFVHGLAQHHGPEHGTWAADAREADLAVQNELGLVAEVDRDGPIANVDDELRKLVDEVRDGLTGEALVRRVAGLTRTGVPEDHVRLVRLMLPFEELLADSGFSRLKRAIRNERQNHEVEADEDVSPLPAEWPGWPQTEGKRAIIVGGEPRPQRREALERAFRFEKLEWLANADGLGRAQSLTERMKNGTIDIVICLRAFSSHKLSNIIFDVPSPMCERVLADTYGVTQVRLALERTFGLSGPHTVTTAEPR